MGYLYLNKWEIKMSDFGYAMLAVVLSLSVVVGLATAIF